MRKSIYSSLTLMTTLIITYIFVYMYNYSHYDFECEASVKDLELSTDKEHPFKVSGTIYVDFKGGRIKHWLYHKDKKTNEQQLFFSTIKMVPTYDMWGNVSSFTVLGIKKEGDVESPATKYSYYHVGHNYTTSIIFVDSAFTLIRIENIKLLCQRVNLGA